MSDLVSTLCAALDSLLLGVEDDGRFRLLSEAPPWSRPLVGATTRGARCVLDDRSPFLDNFLVEATALWGGAVDGRRRSGPWLEPSVDGDEVPLEATALLQHGQRLLLIRMLGEEYDQRASMLQTARDNRLNQEGLQAEVRQRTALIREREEEIAVRLMTAIGVRDVETEAHIRRIGHSAALVAERLGWSADEVADIRVAAPMHDIGKLGIPDEILLKQGRLTDAERAVMQRHTEYGARMLASDEIALLALARRIALSHHEAWDGSGYPERLRGEAIPLAARIVAVVDVYDALTHERPYKPAYSERDALAYLDQNRGVLFDPQLVTAFLDRHAEIRRVAEALRDGATAAEVEI